jgi:hypothetical protein
MKKGLLFMAMVTGVLTLGYSEPVQWNVHNLATWIEAVGGIRSDSTNTTHIITVTGTIAVPPTPGSESTFGAVENISVTLEGSGTITVSSTNGNLLRIGNAWVSVTGFDT